MDILCELNCLFGVFFHPWIFCLFGRGLRSVWFFRKKLGCQVKVRLSGEGRAVRFTSGCRVKVGLSLDCEAVCLSRWTPGALINLAPQPGLLPSSHSSEGILAEWILRPGQFQGNPGALGPDGGDRTSKVTMRVGQAPRTWPHWTLGHFLPGPRIFGKRNLGGWFSG